MKNFKGIMVVALSSVIVLSLAACGNKDVEENITEKGINAFNEIVETYPDKKGFHDAMQHWGFEVESGEKFEWSNDMSANKADFAMVVQAEPLINAGLDVEKLDKNVWLFEEAGKDSMGMEQPALLILPYDISDTKTTSTESDESMQALLAADNDNLIYHEDQQHYVLNLGGTNEVIWTEELGLNDSDMVFVLDAESLIAAGLDIDKLEGSGWVFKEASDKDKTPDQIIKTYSLKK